MAANPQNPIDVEVKGQPAAPTPAPAPAPKNRAPVPEIKRILVPVDFSDFSVVAMEYAILLARQNQATISVIHVNTPLAMSDPIFLPSLTGYPDLVESMTDAAKKQLHEFVNRFKDEPVTIKATLLFGVPFVEILAEAEKDRVGLIVMGTHGRRGVARVLIGSTAEKVVRQASCPVMCVHPGDERFVSK